MKAAQSRRIRLPTVGEFTAHPGCRVTARVDGHVIAVGSATALLGTAGAAALEASMITAVDFLQGEGYTVVVVVCDSHPVGLLAITDQLRPEAAAAISAATKLTGAKPVLLTGDNRHRRSARCTGWHRRRTGRATARRQGRSRAAAASWRCQIDRGR